MDNPAPLEARATVQKSSRFLLAASVLIVVLIVAAVGTYAWYSLFRPCEVNAVEEASSILVSQVKRYDDVYQVATAASRSSVFLPVGVLQQILMDTQQVAVPACMQTAKNELINYMGTVIRAFRAYAAQESDATIRELLNESDTHFDNFTTELEAVKECAPYCIP
jgi:hypothetical protein